MFSSRMTPFGLMLPFACVFFFVGLWLAGPLADFLAYGTSRAALQHVGWVEAFAIIRTFPLAGAAVPLGAMVWLNFDRRGEYLRPVTILLGVLVLSGLVAAICYRISIQASLESARYTAEGFWVGHKIPQRSTSAVCATVGRVPLIAAGVVMATGAIMNRMTWWAVKRKEKQMY